MSITSDPFFLFRLAFACWVLMNILLCAVPRYGAYMMQVTGALMLLSNLLYVGLIPAKPLRIPFEGATLNFHLSYCFWMVFSAGMFPLSLGQPSLKDGT